MADTASSSASHLRVRGLGSGFQHSLCISSPGRSHILALIVAFLGTVLDGNFPFCLVNLHLKQGLSRFKHYERLSRSLIAWFAKWFAVLQDMLPCAFGLSATKNRAAAIASQNLHCFSQINEVFKAGTPITTQQRVYSLAAYLFCTPHASLSASLAAPQAAHPVQSHSRIFCNPSVGL
jgi:hypothetical protein